MGLFGSKKRDEGAGASVRQVTLGDGVTYTIAKSIDCLGDSCPRPQLMTKKAIEGVAAGELVEIVIDNPPSMEAIPPMCPEIGATHVETRKIAKGWQVYVRKD